MENLLASYVAKIDTYSEPPVLIEPKVVEEAEPEPKIVEDSESESEVEESEPVEDPPIETLVNLPVETNMKLVSFLTAIVDTLKKTRF